MFMFSDDFKIILKHLIKCVYLFSARKVCPNILDCQYHKWDFINKCSFETEINFIHSVIHGS